MTGQNVCVKDPGRYPRRAAFSFENIERVWAAQAPESVVTEP